MRKRKEEEKKKKHLGHVFFHSFVEGGSSDANSNKDNKKVGSVHACLIVLLLGLVLVHAFISFSIFSFPFERV